MFIIIESFKKIRKIDEFIPNQLRFHEKKLLLIFVIWKFYTKEAIEKCKNHYFEHV